MSTDKGRYSRVSRRIWNDAAFRQLSQPKPCGGWLFFRLLTGPELTCIPGLFQAWEAGLAQALGWSLKDFRKAFAEIQKEGLARVDWKAGLVWLPKAINHNEPESPNVVTGWRSAWVELPDCELKAEAEVGLRAWCAAKGMAWADAFAKVTGKPSAKPPPHPSSNQEQEQDQEQEQEGDPPNPHPSDFTDFDLASLCPLDLAARAEGRGVIAEWQRKTGASAADCRAAVDELVTYWTIGGGAGQRRNHWLRKVRDQLKTLHEQGRLVGFARKNLAKAEPEADDAYDLEAEYARRTGAQA